MARQHGWAFLIVLVALAIVAFLARDALMQMLGGARYAPGVRPASGEAQTTQAVPAPGTPVERARSLESTVQQGADGLRKRIDDEAR